MQSIDSAVWVPAPVRNSALGRDDSGEIVSQSHPRRHCERSEAIQSLSAEAVWIASLRSQ